MPATEDNRPRFGVCYDLDALPQIVHEKRIQGLPAKGRRVAVIPLPYNSANVRRKVREFTKSLTP